MHTFNLCIGSMLGHPFATKLSSSNQTLVRYWRKSHQPNQFLLTEAKLQGVNTRLVSFNKTRFTSVHRSFEATAKLELPLKAVMRKNPGLVKSNQVCEANCCNLSKNCYALAAALFYCHTRQFT